MCLKERSKLDISKIALFCFLFFLALSASAQKDQNLVKAALIYQLTSHVQWPNTNNNVFTITIYDSSEIYNTLQKIKGRKIQGRKVRLQQTTNLDLIKKSQLVFIPQKHKKQLDHLALTLNNKDILLISDSVTTNKHNVMINFVLNNGSVNFEVNKENIISSGLTIDSDVLLLGGTELDVVQIYRQMKADLQGVEAHSVLILNKLSTYKKNISEANKKLIILNEKINAESLIINNKNLELNAAKEQVRQLNTDVQKKQEQYDSIIDRMSESQENLRLVELKIAKSNEQFLLQKELIIASSNKLSIQDTKIKDQQTTLIRTFILSLIFFFITIFITVQFIHNKRITKNLDKANKDLLSAQDKLVEAEKFSALGLLTAGFSHELNTPLGISITGISFIQDSIKKLQLLMTNGKLSKNNLGDIVENIDNALSLTADNLDKCSELIFTFKEVSVDHSQDILATIKLQDHIDLALMYISSELNENNIIFKVIGDNPTITTYPDLLSRVIKSIVNNAIQHAYQGKALKQVIVEVQNHDNHISITIEDNGIGMTAETLNKLYDPFFTTSRGKGYTGLGMNIVYNLVVKNLQGNITSTSEINKGSTIKIDLPYSL